MRTSPESGENGDDGDDNEYDDEPDIILKEESTGKTLPVGFQCIVSFQ